MPFSSRSAAPTRPRPAASAPAPSSSSASPSTARPRRKSAPHKSPARTSPTSPSTTSAVRTSPGAAAALDAPALLRLLLREGARPSSSLDNRRFRPTAASPGKNGGIGDGQQKKKKGGGGVGSRDALPPPLVGYGRGRRATSTALAGIFAAEGEAESGGRSARGRSPGAAAAAGQGARRAVSVTGTGRARAAAHPYAQGPQGYYAAPPVAAEYSPNRMARALSAGVASALVPVSPVYYAATGAAGPSPLARSFSAGGADRAARMRTPSGNGVARVVELGGHVGDYQAIAA
ncbi:hypothetical protein JCM10450v2_006204 [Rhodotorula kratochvilovae]